MAEPGVKPDGLAKAVRDRLPVYNPTLRTRVHPASVLPAAQDRLGQFGEPPFSKIAALPSYVTNPVSSIPDYSMFTGPEKAFLCMDLSRLTRMQNR